MKYLDTIGAGNASAKGAINIALLDGAAKKAGVALYDFFKLGFKEGKHVTSFTIGIDTPEKIRQKVAEAEQYPILKLKVGGPKDRENIAALRSVAPTKRVRIDGNEGWKTPDEALRNIEWFAKDPNIEFFHPKDAPYLSVITPSTHDMSTLRGWWEEDRSRTQKFYNTMLEAHGEAPVFCEPWVNRALILQHLYSPAMWSIFQLQDLLGMSETLRRQDPHEERINIPADPNHYWKYRMHLSLEQLIKEKQSSASSPYSTNFPKYKNLLLDWSNFFILSL
jgi:hypothetical protein